MNGDLSLSQALGGLRIANPDDTAEASHPPVPNAAPAPAPRAHHDASVSSGVVASSPPGAEMRRSIGLSSAVRRHDSPEAGRSRSSIYCPVMGDAAPASVLARPSKEASPRDPRLSRHGPALPSGSGGSLPPQRSLRDTRGGGYIFASAPNSKPSTPFAGDAPVPASSEEWQDRGAAVSVHREVDSSGRAIVRQVKKGVRDFSFGRVLGEGSYSTVYLATDRQTLKEYAIKVLEKRHIIKEKKIKYVNIEKNTLNRLTEHPGIVRLYYTFQDETSLYYVLDLCNGGELLGVLKKTGTFDVECVRFYGAQILDSIGYMHSRGVIHRDLKPENVLLDDQMHVKITDFGTAKLLRDPREPEDADGEAPDSAGRDDQGDSRAASFVGTAEYVSPELLTHKNACKASDLWAFGCIIYQLLAGRPPFKAGSEYLTFQKIVNLDYEIPPGFPPLAQDLVERCLVLDPARRLAIEHIKNHDFFQGQQFGKQLWRTTAPRLRPYALPAPEPAIIQLNGLSAGTASAPNLVPTSRPLPHAQTATSSGNRRPSRVITELPPPTQLDIEWSPVLTRSNERILKLGDLMVVSAPRPNGIHGKGYDEGHKKLSRFFGGSTTKKRQRLVMVTSSGRIVLAPAGGEEKRAKQDLCLLSPDCSWRSQQDAKGQLVWCVDTGGHHYTFEESKASSSSESGRNSAEEWIECLGKARDLALSQKATSQGEENVFAEMPSAVSSPTSTLDRRANYPEAYGLNERPARNHLSKVQGGHDDSGSRRNRFSKRQSRNGIGSVF